MPTGVGLASMRVAPVATGATACRSGGLPLRTIRMRRMHHMRGGADDVTGLSTAALTASTHANLSGCSGHADRSRPSVDAAASCS